MELFYLEADLELEVDFTSLDCFLCIYYLLILFTLASILDLYDFKLVISKVRCSFWTSNKSTYCSKYMHLFVKSATSFVNRSISVCFIYNCIRCSSISFLYKTSLSRWCFISLSYLLFKWLFWFTMSSIYFFKFFVLCFMPASVKAPLIDDKFRWSC